MIHDTRGDIDTRGTHRLGAGAAPLLPHGGARLLLHTLALHPGHGLAHLHT